MKKTKLIISIFLTIILTTSAVLAWVDLGTVNSSDTITYTLWNNLVSKVNENGNKLNGIYNVGGKIGIGTVNPTESLDVNGNIKITGNGKTVTISVDAWNEILKNLNKTGYKYTTRNNIDGRHTWYGPGTNFRNCEVVQYFQVGETPQNTEVFIILLYVMGSDRTTWSSNVNHAKFLRDFTLHPSYTNTSVSTYGSWTSIIYGPSILESCAVD